MQFMLYIKDVMVRSQLEIMQSVLRYDNIHKHSLYNDVTNIGWLLYKMLSNDCGGASVGATQM
jgi:hypothetical protein